MKVSALFLGLVFSVSVFADSVSFERDGSAATLTGTHNGSSSEIVEFISKAHAFGFRDSKGEDIFKRTLTEQGMRTYLAFENKNVKASMDSAFAVIFKVALKGKKGDIKVASDRSSLTVTGASAKILMGALLSNNSIERGPVGVTRIKSKSGKVDCSKVVHPRSVPTCSIKL